MVATKNKDLRIGVELGLTLPIPDVQFGNIKPVIRIDGIDPSGDIAAQVAEGITVANLAINQIDGNMGTIIDQLLSPEASYAEYIGRMNKLEELNARLVKTVNELVTREKSREETKDTAGVS